MAEPLFTSEEQKKFDAGIAEIISHYPPDRKSAGMLPALRLLQDIKGWLGLGLESGGSDAHTLAELTYLPAPFWAGVWMLLSLGAMGLGLRSILKRRQRVRAHEATAHLSMP